MMHSPIMKIVCIVSWLITALVSLHVGLVAIGWNLLEQPFFAGNFGMLVLPAMYIIGLAGAFSLFSLIMMLINGCKCCGSCSCDKNDRRPYSGM